MKISILTPTYNRAYCIRTAIDCVRKLTIPKGIDYEHIIINDGSTDSTEEVVMQNKHDKLKYVALKKNSGVNAAREAGMKIAAGKYYLFYDSDDEILPDALVKIKNALEKTKQKFMVYRFLTRDHKTGRIMSHVKVPYKNIDYKMRLSGKYASGEFMTLANRKIFQKIKYDQKMLAFEIMYWHLVSKEYQSEVVIPEVTRLYHAENPDRLCRKLVDPKFARKRFEDYKKYLKTFENDYKKFRLNKQLANLYQTAGFYSILSGNKKEARAYFRKSKTLKAIISLFVTFIGVWPFKLYAKIIKRFV